jgi:hypothetical protein
MGRRGVINHDINIPKPYPIIFITKPRLVALSPAVHSLDLDEPNQQHHLYARRVIFSGCIVY